MVASIFEKKNHNVSILYCNDYYSTCPILEALTTETEKKKRCTECQNISRYIEIKLKSYDSKIRVKGIKRSVSKKLSVEPSLSLCSQESTFTAYRIGPYQLHQELYARYESLCYEDMIGFYEPIEEILDKARPNVMAVVFNGRFALANMFSRICYKRGIYVYIHERSTDKGEYRIWGSNYRLTYGDQTKMFYDQKDTNLDLIKSEVYLIRYVLQINIQAF